MNERTNDVDDGWFDLFTPEESAAIAEQSAIRYELAAIEQAFFDDLDRRMREAGFVRLEGEALAWSEAGGRGPQRPVLQPRWAGRLPYER